MRRSPNMFPKSFFTLLFIFILSTAVYGGRVIVDQSSSDLISDGVHGGGGRNSTSIGRERGIISLFAAPVEEACEQSYGFLPCTKTALGNVFLIVVYGYLMFTAATYLSSGSELLLEILGPGLIGGLFLPILGALPDAMLILGKICVSVLSFSLFILNIYCVFASKNGKVVEIRYSFVPNYLFFLKFSLLNIYFDKLKRNYLLYNELITFTEIFKIYNLSTS